MIKVPCLVAITHEDEMCAVVHHTDQVIPKICVHPFVSLPDLQRVHHLFLHILLGYYHPDEMRPHT